jgi:hypothetical protein
MRTASEIRDGIKGEGRVYIKPVFVTHPLRVVGARDRKGDLQVQVLAHGGEMVWHTVLIGDEIWGVGR